MAEKIDMRTAKALIALGEHLREMREALGVPQAALAQRIGMEPTNYAKIERGKKNLTVDTLLRIADGLGVELVVKFANLHRKAT